MIQLRHASEPVLRLVRRAAALDARARNEASSPAERIVARKECDALCEGQHLDVTRMVVPVPEGIVTSGSSDTILTLEGVPWWRGQLALLSAMHAGFGTPKARPWESDGEDWFLRLVGTNHAVAIARALYATAEAVTVSYARYGPKDRIDEYLCGVVLAIGLVFENTHDLDQKALESASAKAMVVYLERESESERLRPMVPVKPQEGELDLAVTAKDRFHPVRRGFDRAKRNRAGEQVLGERRGTTDPVADLFQRIFGR